MKTLIIRHVDQSDPAQFQVVRLADGKSLGPVCVPSPVGFPVPGRPDSDLIRELRRYLESFLNYPFPPETVRQRRPAVPAGVLPAAVRALLIPLALHERFVGADLLESMARQLDGSFDGGRVDRLASALGVAGLLRDRGNRINELHPALSRFLRLTVLDRAAEESRDAWCRAFVDVLGTVAEQYAPKELHEQRGVFQILGANFRSALAEAERLGMDQGFAAAEQWYRKSLAIDEKQGNEHGAASSGYNCNVRVQGEASEVIPAEAIVPRVQVNLQTPRPVRVSFAGEMMSARCGAGMPWLRAKARLAPHHP